MSAVTTYETIGWVKHTEEDVFETGCQPEGAKLFSGLDIFTDSTLDGLIDKLCSFAGVSDRQNVERDAGDEVGRIDIVSLENDDGYPATDDQVALWKTGECRLWDANYTFHVERVTRETCWTLSNM